MSENIFKKSSFKKNVSKLFSIFKKNVSNDNNDKGKSVIKNDVVKHDVLIYPPTTSLFENILKPFFKKMII